MLTKNGNAEKLLTTTEAGPAMRSFTVLERRQSKGRFIRIAAMEVLSCCTASSSGNLMLLKHTKARKNVASTCPTDTYPRCASTVTLFNCTTGLIASPPIAERPFAEGIRVAFSRSSTRPLQHLLVFLKHPCCVTDGTVDPSFEARPFACCYCASMQ